MLTFNVKKEWFEKIKNGEKTHEYREFKTYWINRLVKSLYFEGKDKVNPSEFTEKRHEFLYFLAIGAATPYKTEIQFMNGMFSEEEKLRIYAKMKSIKIVAGLNTDLKINKPVFDIEFELIGGAIQYRHCEPRRGVAIHYKGVKMTKTLSEQLCETCGIKPRYGLYIDFGNLDPDYRLVTNERKYRLIADYRYCTDDEQLRQLTPQYLPDFTKPENFVKLLEIMTDQPPEEVLSRFTDRLRVESGDFIYDKKQAIRETDWNWE